MSSGLREVAVSGWRTKSASVDRKLCVGVYELYQNKYIVSFIHSNIFMASQHKSTTLALYKTCIIYVTITNLYCGFKIARKSLNFCRTVRILSRLLQEVLQKVTRSFANITRPFAQTS